MRPLAAVPRPASWRLVARPRLRPRVREAVDAYACMAMWLVGFSVFTIAPMFASLAISMTKWDIIAEAEFVGLDNLLRLISDPLVRASSFNTIFISLISVPLHLMVALALAVALNQKIRRITIYRTIFFLPSQMPLVASALMWMWIFNPDFGLANVGLSMVGLPPLKWLFDPYLAKPTIVLITLWGGVGTAMLIFLAGLQGIPEHLYEAAAIDGAGSWARFRHVTIPMLSPVIFFNLIIGIISSFQAYFTLIYNTTKGGPGNETLIYVMYIFFKAFQDFQMGYASALSWMLFTVVLALTGLQFLMARRWVHYESGE